MELAIEVSRFWGILFCAAIFSVCLMTRKYAWGNCWGEGWNIQGSTLHKELCSNIAELNCLLIL
jgi:hypothetical protein